MMLSADLLCREMLQMVAPQYPYSGYEPIKTEQVHLEPHSIKWEGKELLYEELQIPIEKFTEVYLVPILEEFKKKYPSFKFSAEALEIPKGLPSNQAAVGVFQGIAMRCIISYVLSSDAYVVRFDVRGHSG